MTGGREFASHFRVPYDILRSFIVEAVKLVRVFSLYYPRRRWLSLSSRAKAFTLQGMHRRFVGYSAFHMSLRGAPLLVGNTAEGVSPSASTEFDAT